MASPPAENGHNMDKVYGGFIILARKLFDSKLMHRPPLYFKLWVWMLFMANFRDHGKIRRGQFFTSIEEMREAMSYRVGYRKMRPSKDEIRSAYEAFTKTTMITTAKTTRGMIITILNYDKYQNFKNYETHTETHDEDSTKPTDAPHYKGKKEKERNNISPPSSFKVPKEFIDRKAEEIYQTFPRKGDSPNSLKSITRILKNPPANLICPVGGLNLAVQNYRGKVEAEGTEARYLIQSNNFFGKAERWKEFLEPIPGPSSKPPSGYPPTGSLLDKYPLGAVQ